MNATDQAAIKEHTTGVCGDEAIPEVDESTGLILFILSLFFGVWATWIGSCLNKGGFNGTAFCAGWLQVLTAPCCFVGLYWCWVHNYKTWQKAKMSGGDTYVRQE